MKSLANVLTSAGQGLDVLRLIRGPFLVSIFAALILCLPDQTREVYRIVAENWVAGSEGAGFKIFVTSVFLVVVTLGVWVSTIDIASHQQQLSRAEDAGWFKRAMLVILPLLPALLIPVGLAIGLLWAASELEAAKFPAAVLNELPKLKTILDRLEEPVQVLERAFLGSLAVAGAMAVIHLTYVSLGANVLYKSLDARIEFQNPCHCYFDDSHNYDCTDRYLPARISAISWRSVHFFEFCAGLDTYYQHFDCHV